MDNCTFPSFEREDGSEAHETLESVSLRLLIDTLTKFPGNPWLAASPGDFFPTTRGVDLTLSGVSPLREDFLPDAFTLPSSLADFEDAILLSSLDGNFSLTDFLGACRIGWGIRKDKRIFFVRSGIS